MKEPLTYCIIIFGHCFDRFTQAKIKVIKVIHCAISKLWANYGTDNLETMCN